MSSSAFAAAVPRARSRTADRARRHWSWLAAGLVVAFATPYLLADVLGIERDLYYGIYASVVFGFFAAWLRFATERPRVALLRNWRWGVALGVLAGALLVLIALGEHATSRPHGATLAAAIVWRGIVYGAADGVLLSAFPILAVFAAFSARPLRERRKRARAAIGALALAVSLLFTGVYHLGYSDFRSAKVRKPLVGDVVWSAPTLATLSPVGAPLAHVALHVAAVVHSYDTDTFLPPHRK
jgi:hypothetical protein